MTDVASTKTSVLEWAERILPETVHFVGGHPMAGKETAGIDAADAGLFRGATWCILPGRGCAPEAVGRVEAIVRSVGAVPYYLDPAEHDSYVAAVSHVPFVAAAALVANAAGAPSWRDMQRLAAGGFRDATRTASGDVAMHRDICLTNRDAVARWLDGLIAELARARDLVLRSGESDADREALEDFFVQAKVARDKWVETRGAPSAEVVVPMPEARSGLSEMLFGRRRRELSAYFPMQNRPNTALRRSSLADCARDRAEVIDRRGQRGRGRVGVRGP